MILRWVAILASAGSATVGVLLFPAEVGAAAGIVTMLLTGWLAVITLRGTTRGGTMTDEDFVFTMRRARRGDTVARGDLVEWAHDAIEQSVRSVMRNSWDDAEGVIQEVKLKLLRIGFRRRSFSDMDAWRRYCGRAAKNTARTGIGRSVLRARLLDLLPKPSLDTGGPEHDLDYLKRALRGEIKTWTEFEQDVFWLVVEEQLTQAEIAELLDFTREHINRTYRRLLNRVRQLFDMDLEEEGTDDAQA